MSTNTGITPLTPAQEAKDEQQVVHEGHVMEDLIAVDELGNTLLLGGHPGETMSSHFARMATEDTGVKKEIGELASKGLDLFQKDHGANAEAGDVERAKIVTGLEDATGELPTK